jgi:hypothetical protein
MNTCWGLDEYVHVFCISALIGGEPSALRSFRFTRGKGTDTHGIGGCVGLKAGLGNIQKWTFFTPTGTGSPTPWPCSLKGAPIPTAVP